MLIRSINLDLGNSFCSTTEENFCPASDEDQGNTDKSDKNRVESPLFGDGVEDDQRNQLNEIFWGDATRAATHERLEWWLAQIRNLNFPHLEEHLYRCVSIDTGSLGLGLVQSNTPKFIFFPAQFFSFFGQFEVFSGTFSYFFG